MEIYFSIFQDLIEAYTRLNSTLLPLIKMILVAISIFLILFLIFYIIVIIIHESKSKKSKNIKAKYYFIIKNILNNKSDLKQTIIPKEEQIFVKELLLEKLKISSKNEEKNIREIYKSWGLHKTDIKQLNSKRWWKKIEAIERLEKIHVNEVENKIINLMNSPRKEIRYAALKYLVEINSEKINPLVYILFRSSSRWSFRYLVNILSGTHINPKYLYPLAFSENRDLRKAAAILLGHKDSDSSLPLLEKLVQDPIKDVRRESILSLGEINTEKSLSILINYCKDPHYQIRAAVAKSLGKYNSIMSLNFLKELADDNNFEVRLQAFYSLKQIGDSGRIIIKNYKNKYPELVNEFLKINESEI